MNLNPLSCLGKQIFLSFSKTMLYSLQDDNELIDSVIKGIVAYQALFRGHFVRRVLRSAEFPLAEGTTWVVYTYFTSSLPSHSNAHFYICFISLNYSTNSFNASYPEIMNR